MANFISMADFAMSTERKRAMLVPPEFTSALSDFLRCFEAGFGDADWDMTRDILTGDGLEYYIHPNGTFLEPGVSDESNNWHNRGALLATYRRLNAVFTAKNFNVVEIHPCGVVTKLHSVEPNPANDFVI